jgi:hypothetical protein
MNEGTQMESGPSQDRQGQAVNPFLITEVTARSTVESGAACAQGPDLGASCALHAETGASCAITAEVGAACAIGTPLRGEPDPARH